jgi:PGF-CTERM protein
VKRAFLVVAAVGLLSVPVPAGPPAQSGEIDPDDVVLSVAVEEDGAAGDGSTGDGAGFGSLLALAALAGAALLARRHGP